MLCVRSDAKLRAVDCHPLHPGTEIELGQCCAGCVAEAACECFGDCHGLLLLHPGACQQVICPRKGGTRHSVPAPAALLHICVLGALGLILRNETLLGVTCQHYLLTIACI